MPFVKKIEIPGGMLGIWEFKENLQELEDLYPLSSGEKTEFERIKSEKRQKEYLVSRILLQELTGSKPRIGYYNSGKPYLKNLDWHISISHSEQLVTVCISSLKSGVDVEDSTRNIDRILNRFLHSRELARINNSKQKQIAGILYWSAKEAIFKCTEKEGIQFNKQILIDSFELKEHGSFSGKLNRETTYKLWYLFYKNNVIVYCVED